jgi:hypothetical protein
MLQDCFPVSHLAIRVVLASLCVGGHPKCESAATVVNHNSS